VPHSSLATRYLAYLDALNDRRFSDLFFGLAPTGRRISFCEHVFYRFRDGRIAQVWSLIDRDAVATQLTE
jgi:predicted ester cyclase